jgi:GNAT superfamily N-acetyltransferase
VEVRRIDADDDDVFGHWFDLWRLTDLERWPDHPGWGHRELRALARHRGRVREHQLLAAFDGDVLAGVALMDVPQLDNRHSVGVDVRVHPARRRRGVGTALVEEVARRARADHRTVVNAMIEVPTEQVATHPGGAFARAQGFEATLLANRRHLALPVDPGRLAGLRRDVSLARGVDEYETITFVSPWPEEYTEDHCAMERRMSTDAPSGDAQTEEEVWDAARIAENDDLLAAQGLTKLTAVARHIGSGRLVAFSEVVFSETRPTEAWQWATLVVPEHRGHRLGLAVKLANLDFLATALPTARLVITGNAQGNAPMIDVNDLLGFEIVATGTFWQKALGTP